MDGWLEEIKEEKTIFNLEDGDKYWYIDDYIINYVFIKGGKYVYNKRLEVGNIFLTEEESEKELEKRKTLTSIKKWAYKNNIQLSNDYNEDDCVILYDDIEHKFYVGKLKTFGRVYCDLVFYSCEDIEKCIKECEQELKILFGLK